MEKTIHEWFNELGEPYRTKAINNTKVTNHIKKRHSLHQALEGAFNWKQSPEGYSYWFSLYDTILDSEE